MEGSVPLRMGTFLEDGQVNVGWKASFRVDMFQTDGNLPFRMEIFLPPGWKYFSLHGGHCSARVKIFHSGWKSVSLQDENLSPSRVDNVLRGWKYSIRMDFS